MRNLHENHPGGTCGTEKRSPRSRLERCAFGRSGFPLGATGWVLPTRAGRRPNDGKTRVDEYVNPWHPQGARYEQTRTVVTKVFALALLLTSAAAPAPTAADVARGVNDSLEQNDGGGALLAVGGGLGAALLGAFVWSRRGEKQKPAVTPPRAAGRGGVVDSRRKLEREVRQSLGLSRREWADLRREARERGWSDPMLPLVCPSLRADE